MLAIGICEDQEIELKEIQEMVSRIMFSKADIRIRRYTSGKAVLEEVQSGKFECNLLLLDIHMAKPDGMDLAHELRRMQVDVDIIFITWSQEHIFEGYTCKAFAYILKPCSAERLSEELIRYLDELENTSECLNVKVQGNIRRIPLNQIFYLESDKRKIILHTRDGETEFYEKMDAMEDLLKGKGFVRCHQSYIVQKQYVNEFSRSGMIIQDVQIPISRRYYDSLKKMFE